MTVAGSGATRTVRGTTVPTLTSKLTLVTRGADPVNTVWRILVFCSVLSETLLPPPPERSAVPCLLPLVEGDCDCWVDGVWPLLVSCDCCEEEPSLLSRVPVDGLRSCDCFVVVPWPFGDCCWVDFCFSAGRRSCAPF